MNDGGVKRERRHRLEVLILVPIAVALLGWQVWREAQLSGPPIKPTSLVNAESAAIRESCIAGIRDKLSSPQTARFDDPSLPRWGIEGSGWTWNSYVSAENSFGAMTRSGFTCRVTGEYYDGAQVTTSLN